MIRTPSNRRARRRLLGIITFMFAALSAVATVSVAPAGAVAPPESWVLSVVAGTGVQGLPTPGPAANSKLSYPTGAAVDASGNTYIADNRNYAIEKVTPAGVLSVFAGKPGIANNDPAPGPATSSEFGNISGVAVDASGNVYAVDSTYNLLVKITPGGTMSILAGVPEMHGAPTPGPATASRLYGPYSVAVDSSGNVYIADTFNSRIEKVTPGGTLSIIAGTGVLWGTPIAGPATSSGLNTPYAVAVDGSGNLYVADTGNHRIEKITPAGTLSIIAGTGVQGAPTAGPATSSKLSLPGGIAVDSSGNVFVSDTGNNRIEKITPDGTLSIIAGTGSSGQPTAGPALSSNLNAPAGISVDAEGRLYIADELNHRIERLSVPTAPGAPTSLSATVTSTSTARVSFTAPASDGGSAITKYQYKVADGSWIDGGSSSPVTVTGISNYANVAVRIRAVNAIGNGTASLPVTVRSQLAGPTISSANATGRRSVNVNHSGITVVGGRITGYTATAFAKGTDIAVSTCHTAQSGRSCTINSLAPGTQYDIRVVAYLTITGSPVTRQSLPSARTTVTTNS